MNASMKLIFPAVFATACFASPCVQAATASTNAPGGGSQAAMTALFGDPVIAKGKGFEVKRSELDQVVTGLKSAYAARGQSIPPAQLPAIENQVLNRLIQTQLLLQKATSADRSSGVVKTDLQMSNLLARVGSQAALDRQMKAVDMTSADLRLRANEELTAWSVVLPRELNVVVTDAEVKQFYDDTNHMADFEQPEMVRTRHILLMTMDPVTRTPLSADQQQAKRKQMDDILKRIRGGADFSALAKQYSEDPGSKDNGGELPPFPRGQGIMVPEFEAAAFSLTNNQVSDVVASTYGYHIIKLIDRTPAKRIDYATAAPKIKEYLEQQQIEKRAPAYLNQLKQGADVQILDPDLKAAAAAAAALPAVPSEP